MGTLDRLAALLPAEVAREINARCGQLTQVGLRANRPVQLSWPNGEALAGEALDAGRLRGIVSALMDYSFYAREAELSQGFFTMNDGCRVGFCGRFARDGDAWRLTDVGSVCVRVARPVPGCADAIMDSIDAPDGLRSTLILSRPGMGKTTLLRDIARQLSEAGYRVGVSDERHELAACASGIPTLDVGSRTDVMDGCPRTLAIPALIRSTAPEVIVADEIGGEGDARALADAARCGVAVVASAHGESVEAAFTRPAIREAILGGAIRQIVRLGPRPGEILEVRALDGGGDARWKYA